SGIRSRQLEVLIQTGADVQHQRGADGANPVEHAGFVLALEGDLAVLRRPARDAVGGSLLGPLVLAVTYEDLGLVADVLIDLGGNVSKGVEREVRGKHEVVAPGIAAGRRGGVGTQKILTELPRHRIDASGWNEVSCS